jgi:hypothetical protein
MLLVMTLGTLVVLDAYGALPVLSLLHEGCGIVRCLSPTTYCSNDGLGKLKFGNFVSIYSTNSKEFEVQC